VCPQAINVHVDTAVFSLNFDLLRVAAFPASPVGLRDVRGGRRVGMFLRLRSCAQRGSGYGLKATGWLQHGGASCAAQEDT
jgi:hypothetical protein